MAYEHFSETSLDYLPCRYGTSKLLFRGPRRKLDGDYVLFLGGTETYGKFIERPFPALVEEQSGVKCVNFGWPNAGLDVFLNDQTVIEAARGAQAVVWQVPGAHNLTNRFYKVHPRRNDRFLAPTPLLRSIYPEVDFTEFHFTRHLLGRLRRVSPDRFATVLAELQQSWVARMRLMIERVQAPVILLWVSVQKPPAIAANPDLTVRPNLVDSTMMRSVSKVAAGAVCMVGLPEGETDGMVFGPLEEPAAQELPGPKVHAQIARKLGPMLVRTTGEGRTI